MNARKLKVVGFVLLTVVGCQSAQYLKRPLRLIAEVEVNRVGNICTVAVTPEIWGPETKGGATNRIPHKVQWIKGSEIEATWEVRITSKSAADQDPGPTTRGDLIRTRFWGGNMITFRGGSLGSIRSRAT